MRRDDQTSSIAVIGLLSSCAMLTVVLLKKSTVQQKLHIPRGDKLQRPSKSDYKHQNFGLLEFWNVLFILVFTLLKTFCHCMH